MSFSSHTLIDVSLTVTSRAAPRHHDPVLGAMMMLLQRQPPPGLTMMRLTWWRSPLSTD
jgi:hypothetical protein